MSIWCSWPAIGHEPFDPDGEHVGDARTFAEGFSNHYPDVTGSHELPACVDLAHIAPWCVPGHAFVDDVCETCGTEHDHPEVGPWLRLGVTSEKSLSWWHVDGKPGSHETPGLNATVVLDEAAVLKLYHDLGDWLMMPKVQPADPAVRAGGGLG